MQAGPPGEGGGCTQPRNSKTTHNPTENPSGSPVSETDFDSDLSRYKVKSRGRPNPGSSDSFRKLQIYWDTAFEDNNMMTGSKGD